MYGKQVTGLRQVVEHQEAGRRMNAMAKNAGRHQEEKMSQCAH